MRTLAACTLALLILWSRPLAAQQAAAVPTWRLEQAVRIGAIEGPDAIASVRDVTLGSDGSIFVAEGMTQSVRVYSASGRLLRTFGRRGAGPGEFYSLDGLAWVGDTLLTEDVSLQRFTRFDQDGTPRGTFRPLPVGAYINAGVFADGSILGRPRSRRYAEMDGPPMPLLRLRTAGAVTHADTLTHVKAYGSGSCAGERLRVCLGGAAGVGTADVFAMHPRGRHLTVVSGLHATGTERRAFTVTRLSPSGDTLMKSDVWYMPVAIPASYRDSVSAHWVTVLTNPPPDDRPSFTRQEALAVVRDGLQFPEYFPPVYDVHVSEAGDTWLQVSAQDKRQTWIVLDERGRRKANVLGGGVPVAVHHISTDTVWGVVRDELGVSYVVGLAFVTDR